MSLNQFITDTLALDLELTRHGVKRIGAVWGERTFEWAGGTSAKEAFAQLDHFANGSRWVLGHNLFHHDLPFLMANAPDLKLLQLPVVDTLYLSPLAFPQHPYHRLVKDYKLVRSSVSDPLKDSRLALSIFRDQWKSFACQAEQFPELISFYRFAVASGNFKGFTGDGLAAVFDRTGAQPLETEDQAIRIFESLTQGLVCRTSVERLFHTEAEPANTAPQTAYALAWLRVAGANSVLPPWVRHQFPGVVPLLKALRDVPCGNPDCSYCRETHDADRQLKRFFGFDAFREEPRSSEGESLQRTVALNGLRDRPLLAILPTGGGKSVCYQLPALVRHMRRGLLTVVISPLQALMKDQVDNLVKNTGTPYAAAIYGLLTPPERGEVIERVRLGDIAILYLSPEQLRSRSVRRVLSLREIGCWVFDEAHCLSKWGHDFRPDYMYAARFIREFSRGQHLPIPPIACFTATAKPDVIEEIRSYFQTELKQELLLFEGGVERDNLQFDIWPVSGSEKLASACDIVTRYTQQQPEAGVIVYAAKRKTTEEIRDYFVHHGVVAEAFHAGLEANEKRRIIESFVAGEIPVICATNAFGMGIDKENIRLVLHYDIPGSLENYLQEAGRAGRDLQPAECILLYDPEDAETQFRLGAYSEIQKNEIQQILKSLRRSKINRENEVVITTQELIREETASEVFDRSDPSNDTRVRTALSWLERADFLTREHNMTQVFQGRPRVKSVVDAEPVIAGMGLSTAMTQLWRGILGAIFNASADQGLSADDIAERLFPSAEDLKSLEKEYGLKPSQMVIYAMHDMAAAGLLDKGMMLSAYLRPKGKNNARKLLTDVCDLETRFLKLMQEEAPDAEAGQWLDLDISRANQRLQNMGEASNPVTLRNLLKSLTYDGTGLAGSHGSIALKHMGRNRYRVSLQRSWQAIREIATLRRNVSEVIIRELTTNALKALPETAKANPGDLLVEFGAHDLAKAIGHDLLLHSQVKKPLAAIDRSLMFLHENKIIILQNGLAVFRQAMTIRLNHDDRKRPYTVGDYKPLATHYRERRFQVHVIMEYANLAMEKIAQALGLVLDYFSLPRDRFVEKYFGGREDILERATSAEAYRQIVEKLNNPIQIQAVGSPITANTLILAGPGAGKTRVVVHRCAYLLRVERVAARRILIMCFNHNAAVSLRKRLHDLVGQEARGVTVATYHGAAMRLAGISLREIAAHQKVTGRIDFDGLIRSAVALLKGETEVPGLAPDEARDQLLQGYSHILVDEYQDIDQLQYNLVSAIAGRTLNENEGRLSIMAVGDDDQNIYAFKGANVGFIKRFQEDYGARTVYMVENYRSSAHIIRAVNQLIDANRDRMKIEHPIRINRQRKEDAPGGPWAKIDPYAQGRVQRLVVQTPAQQAEALYREMIRLRELKPSLAWDDCAILGRTHRVLTPVRALLEEKGLPIKRGLESGLPLYRIREIHHFLERVKCIEDDIRSASQLVEALPGSVDGVANPNPWIDLLSDLIDTYRQETADVPLPLHLFVDWLYEALAEQRREKTIGKGVFLNTVHAAKGLEFNHIFVLDGEWRMPAEQSKQEEERRLLYVGMTRAIETLCLLEFAEQGNPFLRALHGEWMLKREASSSLPDNRIVKHRHYTMLGLHEINLGHAGTFAADHPIHQHLAKMEVGDRVAMVAIQGGISLCTDKGFCVAKLSQEGCRNWEGKIDAVTEGNVLGTIYWFADDGQPEFRGYAKVPSWQVPLLEIVLED